jgi:hypothetical protein
LSNILATDTSTEVMAIGSRIMLCCNELVLMLVMLCRIVEYNGSGLGFRLHGTIFVTAFVII